MATDIKPLVSRDIAHHSAPKFSLINQFHGRIAVISMGEVNVELVILLSNQESIVATAGLSAFEKMDARLNSPVTALVRESTILLSSEEDTPMLSTRNSMSGIVSSIKKGPVNAEVTLQIKGNASLVSTIGIDELNILKCHPGDRVSANFKASEVIIATRNIF